jgi:polyisoprenoid-binding protein YceI
MTARRLLTLALTTLALVAGAAAAERLSGTLLEGSLVRYDASAGWETWQGVAPARVDRLSFDDADLATLRLEVRVAADDFASGNIFRDRNARRVVFETDEHPDVVFSLQRALPADDGGAMTLPDGAERVLSLRGTLDLHGVQREVEVPVTVRRSGDRLAVTGGFDVLLSDYAMTAPSLFGRGVDDRVTVRFDLVVALAPG